MFRSNAPSCGKRSAAVTTGVGFTGVPQGGGEPDPTLCRRWLPSESAPRTSECLPGAAALFVGISALRRFIAATQRGGARRAWMRGGATSSSTRTARSRAWRALVEASQDRTERHCDGTEEIRCGFAPGRLLHRSERRHPCLQRRGFHRPCGRGVTRCARRPAAEHRGRPCQRWQH